MNDPIPTTQEAVLQAIVDRLREQLDLNPSTCFLSIDPEPCANISHNLFLTVSPDGGQFREGEFAGAGENLVIENTHAVITIFSQIRLDRVEHATSFLTDNARGVLTMKRKVLKALAGHILVDTDGNALLVDYLEPVSAPRPQSDRAKIGDVQLWFSTNFHWDLS